LPTRRQFLAGLGATALAAPFTRLLTGTARADSAQARRLVVFATPNGTVPDRLWPTGSGADFTFGAGTALEPLTAIQDKVTVLRGLDFHNANNHEGGMAAMLTNRGDAGSATGGRSLDQVVAEAVGGSTRFSSLELGVVTSNWGGSNQTRMCYSGPGQFVTPDDDPLSVYERMFGDVLGGAEEAARLRARRGSVLDLVSDELADLRSRVGTEERIKLDTHLDAIATMEAGLDTTTTCEPGAPPDIDGWYRANDNFPAVGAAQMDLGATALACGMTNVVTIQWAHTVSPIVFSWLGLSDGHHTLSHSGDNTQGADDYTQAERWFAERFVDLVQSLDALPDPEGDGSLLDSTVVLWAQEMGDGRLHVCQDVPFVLAGAPGCFTPGRYLDLGGRPHAGLLVSIANAFGLGLDTFGDPTAGTGGIEELA